MRTLLLVWAACGDQAETTGPTDLSDPPPPPVPFVETAEGGALEGGFTGNVVETQQATNAMLAATAVLLSDTEVQGRLLIDNGSDLRAAPEICWSRPSPAMSEFTMDFTGCGNDYNMSGGVRIEDHPAGPVLFQFLDFTLDERVVGGVLGLELTETGRQWHIFDTDTFSPGPDNRVPITVTVGGTASATTIDGGLHWNTIPTENFHLWGTATGTTLSDTRTAVMGGTVAGIDPYTDPGADAPTFTCGWQTCRCQLSGVTSYAAAVELETVRVDIDDLQDGDDGFDDPDVEFVIDVEITGRLDIEAAGCGVWTATFTTDALPAIAIERVALESAIQRQCEIKAIDDEHHCVELEAMANASSGIELSISAAKLGNLVQNLVDNDFDNNWCTFNE